MQSLKLCLNIKNIQIGKNNVIIKKNKVRKNRKVYQRQSIQEMKGGLQNETKNKNWWYVVNC